MIIDRINRVTCHRCQAVGEANVGPTDDQDKIPYGWGYFRVGETSHYETSGNLCQACRRQVIDFVTYPRRGLHPDSATSCN